MSPGILVADWAGLAGLVVVHVLWQGAIIGLLAACALRIARTQTPQVRYALSCFFLLLLTALLPLNLVRLTHTSLNQEISNPYSGPVSFRGLAGAPEPLEPAISRPLPITETRALPTPEGLNDPALLSVGLWHQGLLPWLGRCWAFGCLLLALYNVAGLLAVARMRASAVPAGVDLQMRVERLQAAMGIAGMVQVRFIEHISSALVVGWFRPMILLPAATVVRLTPEALEAVLAHELAHIKRWDLWVNAVQRAVETVLFFHPVVWWLSARIRDERELCCDDEAMGVCGDPVGYAGALLALAEHGRTVRLLALSSHGGSLMVRVRHILGLTPQKQPLLHGRVGTSMAMLGLLVLCMLAIMVGTIWQRGANDKTIAFPATENAGIFSTRPAGQDQRVHGWQPGHRDGWSLLAMWKGAVDVPADTELRLEVSTNDLSSLSRLEPDTLFFLDCRGKELMDKDVAAIAALRGLRGLDLSRNPGITDAGLMQLEGLEELEWLNLEDTGITGVDVDLAALFPRLQYLAAGGRGDTGNLAAQLGGLEDLEYVFFRNCRVDDAALKELRGKQRLLGIYLEGTGTTDEGFASIGPLENLQYLAVMKNPITDGSAGLVHQYPQLRSLNFEITGITDAGVAHLTENQELEDVFLKDTRVTDQCLQSLAVLSALATVKLDQTAVTAAALASFQLNLRAAIPEQAPQTPGFAGAPRIGLVMSDFTATGGGTAEKAYSYSAQDSRVAARALAEANFDLYAVIEPGTEASGELPEILAEAGLTEKIMDGYDPVALGKLDAIVISGMYNARVEMLEAVAVAVEAGVGLVNYGATGSRLPGEEHPAVSRLTGLTGGQYTWGGQMSHPCTVKRAHPILGDLMRGDTKMLMTLDGVTPPVLPDDIEVVIDAPDLFPQNFAPLYTRQLGKGRVVNNQWHRMQQPALGLPGHMLLVRSVNWAAGVDADTLW